MRIHPLALKAASILVFSTFVVRFSDVYASGQPTVFDANGYYFPQGKNIVVNGVRIEKIEIKSATYYYNGALQDEPRSTKPLVKLTLVDEKTARTHSYKCRNPVVANGTFKTSCPMTALGAVLIDGRFVDDLGQFWNRREIIPYKTVVATAKVRVVPKGGNAISEDLLLTYWEGH